MTTKNDVGRPTLRPLSVGESGEERVPRPQQIRLSLLMPVYNEEPTLRLAINRILAVDYGVPIELVIVDDGSTDRTPEILESIDDPRVVVHRQANGGKGAAVRAALRRATGTHVVPFDADLEYSPADIPRMIEPLREGLCDVVFGTRLFGSNTVYQSFVYAMGNKITTLAANLMFDAYLSDLHTCFKLMPRELMASLPLSETGFGFDSEVTAHLLRRGIRPFEVPISYHSRTREEGKKITWHDGVTTLRVLTRVRLSEKGRGELQSFPPRAVPGGEEPRPRRGVERFRRPSGSAEVG